MSAMNRRAEPSLSKPPAAAADRREDLRGALLYTVPGRAIVIGLAIKLGVFLVGLAIGQVPAFFTVVDAVAGLAVAAGLVYFAFRVLVLAKRRLLWRVRRKLIVSYMFIGFVPAFLLVAFSLLCAFLLFYNFSSYRVQSRLRALSDQARFLAQSTALDIQRAGGRDVANILTRRQAAAAAQYPGASMAVVPFDRACGTPVAPAPSGAQTSDVKLQTSGPWTHVNPTNAVPAWIDCSGFAGVLAYSHRRDPGGAAEETHLLVRGVAFPD